MSAALLNPGRWIFALKLFTAAMLAFTIAVHIGLPQPYWSLVTCCVLMNPVSGAMLSKALYRFIGTMCAGAIAVILARIFGSQQILMVGMSGLVATAAFAMGVIDRTPRAYGFQLLGITMLLVVVPAISQPESMFTTALARLTEIGLGIICVTVIDSIVVPRSIGPVMHQKLQVWLPDAQRWLRDVLNNPEQDQDDEHAAISASSDNDRLRMIADMTALSALASQIKYDPLIASRERGLIFAIQQRLLRLVPMISAIESRLAHPDQVHREAVAPMLAEASALLEAGKEPPADFIARMDAAEYDGVTGWRRLVQRNLSGIIADALTVSAELHALENALNNQGNLSPDLETAVDNSRPFPLRPDFHMAARVALAIASTYGILSLIWYFTGWKSVPYAMLFGPVALAFFGSMDEAAAVLTKFSRFALFAFAAGGVLSYILLPMASDYTTFILAMAIYMIPLTLWAFSNPLVILVMVVSLSTINLQGTYAPASFNVYLDSTCANLMGIFVAFFCLRMVRQLGTEHAVRRFIHKARADIYALTWRANSRDRDQYVIRALDSIGALAGRLQAVGAEDESPRLMTRLRVGVNIADLRRAADRSSGALRQALENVLATIRDDLDKDTPSPALLERIDAALSLAVRQHKTDEVLFMRGLVGLRLALFEKSPAWSAQS
ncbi:FUSC family protein [Altericroceibacterium endophyticum]|uniref:FUSC family protein n=1 Tax=Altericroceibacterium endophyticum TaxID=1808508 RepID=A0A6I4T3Q6_9SPHN|nr:FUSC family protein [Altericroceibacterium endophyticum]MXO64165.1 FUSC family protein [Altericroceibacterium endophyticum]